MANRDSRDPQQLLETAISMHQEQRRADADGLYAQVLQLEPENPLALRLRGILARELGDIGASVRYLEQAAAAAPANAEALSELGLSQMAAGELELSEGALRNALVSHPRGLKALTNLGALLQFRGHIQEAITHYRLAVEIDSEDLEVRCNLAKALVDAGLHDQAIEEAESAVQHSGGHPYALSTQGVVLCFAERFDDAVHALEASLARDPNDETALVNLGFAHINLNRVTPAIDAWERALAVNPHNARSASDLANALAAEGRPKDALRLCEAFTARHPGEPLVLAIYAQILRDAGREQEARTLLDYDGLIRTVDIATPEGFDSVTAFNDELTTLLVQDPSLLESPAGKSTCGGSQTGELDFEEQRTYSALRRAIESAAENAIAGYHRQFPDHPILARAHQPMALRGWGTVLGGGGHQTSHLHPLAWLSGVYYARIPIDMDPQQSDAGWIEFGGLPERYHAARTPDTHRIQPREGRLVLFPAWCFHRTLPFETPALRVSLAFDLAPKSALRLV